MATVTETSERVLREALEASGQRFTEQRAAVYRYLSATTSHPTAEEVFREVRGGQPGISLATVYKSLETFVGCGLAMKLTYSDGSARYDGRTDPHPHVRCVECGRVADVHGRIPPDDLASLRAGAGDFRVTGYRLELTGYCTECDPGVAPARA
ncbi:MAG: transcriptional repressor [Gemmatimonadetes bacterium]|nr:transcriptional repressor [Gemmatimonadota bacterium]